MLCWDEEQGREDEEDGTGTLKTGFIIWRCDDEDCVLLLPRSTPFLRISVGFLLSGAIGGSGVDILRAHTLSPNRTVVGGLNTDWARGRKESPFHLAWRVVIITVARRMVFNIVNSSVRPERPLVVRMTRWKVKAERSFYQTVLPCWFRIVIEIYRMILVDGSSLCILQCDCLLEIKKWVIEYIHWQIQCKWISKDSNEVSPITMW